jgi:tRNA A-37 threonylcarbamoyl transferase component Bud32
MLRARKLGVPTPVLYNADLESSCIVMENVLGESVKSVLKSRSLEPAGEGWVERDGDCRGRRAQGKIMLV